MVRWLVAVMAVLHLPGVALAGGSPECPCVNPWDDVPVDAGGPCADDPARPRAVLVAGESVCVADDYGADECRAWDSDISQCLQNSPPEWCGNAWCYVNSSNCLRPNHEASSFPDSALSYSYETCGNVDSYIDYGDRFDWLQGRELRVSMPGDSSSGYTLVTDPDGGRNGSVYTFMQNVANDAGFTWVEKPITPSSRARFNASSFTACVHDVALNETDLCIGNFWMTAQRLHLATFTTPIYDDSFSLVTKSRTHGDPTWGYYFSKPLKPFTYSAWAGIMFCVLYMSAAMILIEVSEIKQETSNHMEAFMHLLEEREEAVKGRGCLAQVRRWVYHRARKSITTSGAAQDWSLYRSLERIDMMLNGVGRSAFLGVIGLTSGSPSHTPRSFPGRLVVAGFAFFLLVVFSSYTAGILNALIKTEALVQLTFEDLQRDGDHVCVVSAAAVSFRLRYPDMASRIIEVPNAKTALDQVGETCRAAVVMHDAWERFSTTHCDLVASKESAAVMFVPNAMPVREDLRDPISYFMIRAIQEQQYKQAMDEAKMLATIAGRLPSINQCTADRERLEKELGAGDTQLVPTDFIASYIVTIGCTTMGLVIFFGCGYASDPSDTTTRTLHGALDGDDEASRSRLRKMPLSQLRDIALQYGPRKEGSTVDIDPNFANAVAAAVNEAPNATKLIDLVLDCPCEFSGSERGTLKRWLRKLSITQLLHRAKKEQISKEDRKVALDSLFPHAALCTLILDTIFPTGSDGTHNTSSRRRERSGEHREKTNYEIAMSIAANDHPILRAAHCNEQLGVMPVAREKDNMPNAEGVTETINPVAEDEQDQVMQMVQMECPAGCGPGSTVQSEVNGKLVQVVVPQGISEGQMFQVQVAA